MAPDLSATYRYQYWAIDIPSEQERNNNHRDSVDLQMNIDSIDRNSSIDSIDSICGICGWNVPETYRNLYWNVPVTYGICDWNVPKTYRKRTRIVEFYHGTRGCYGIRVPWYSSTRASILLCSVWVLRYIVLECPGTAEYHGTMVLFIGYREII